MTVEITHGDKILFPRDKITKAQMVEYYETVSEFMLPYLRNHPVAMLRFNKGIDGERFFHKNTPKHFPDFIDRAPIPVQKRTTVFPVINNLDALRYIANHNTIEFHLLPVPADHLYYPDTMIFDLDPSIDDFGMVKDAAKRLRTMLEERGFATFPLLSGSRGIHTWVPLDGSASVEEVMSFSEAIARELVDADPDHLTLEFTKADRGDRIYIDIARNAYAQHAIAPFSLRAKDGAPAATTITWDELDDRKLKPSTYTIITLPKRLAKVGDPWADMRSAARGL